MAQEQGIEMGNESTQAGNKKFLATRWAVWKSLLEKAVRENQTSPKLGPVRSQLKSSVMQKGFTGLQGGVRGGSRLEPQWSGLLGWRSPCLGS